VSNKIRVAILDDHQSIVDGYCFRLSQADDIEITATAGFGNDLEPMLNSHSIDVLILDISVPISNESPTPYPILHLIPKLIEQYPDMTILVISMYHQGTLIKNVMNAGASGYILKDDRNTLEELASVIRSVAKGGIYLSRLAHEKLYKNINNDSVLTIRQAEVLSLCAAYPNKSCLEISQIMDIANSTVRNLLSSAYLRLKVKSRPAAIAKAQRLGLLVPHHAGGEIE
jgi:two-component system nitrate/nitrite response regulator NarL